MVAVLEVLLERDALVTGMQLDELAPQPRLPAALPELMRDLEGVKSSDDPRRPNAARWFAYWRKNPIAVRSGCAGSPSRTTTVSYRTCPRRRATRPTLAAMTRGSLVEWRPSTTCRGSRAEATGDAFECVVISKQSAIRSSTAVAHRAPTVPSGERPTCRLPRTAPRGASAS